MRTGADVKVGVVVLVALVLLGLAMYYLIGVYAARRGFALDVTFDRADVRAGDGVTMAGVSVGRVEWVRLTGDNRALVRLRLRDGVAVRRGYRISAVSAGLVGETFVEITPVAGERAGRKLQPGERVQGQPSVRLESLAADAQALMRRLTAASESVTELVTNQRMRQLIEGSLAGLQQATRSMNEVAQALGEMAAEARPRMRAVLANVDEVTRDLRQTSKALAQATAENGIPANLQEAARRLASAVERVDDIAAQFQELAADPELKDFAKTAARNLRDTSGSIKQAGEDLRSALASIKQGAQDVPDITANAREASANIRDASVKIKEVAEEAGPALSKVSSGAVEAAKAFTELPQVRTNLLLGGQYLMHDRRWWVEANLDLLSRDRLLRIGAVDIGESDRVNFQLGQPFGPGRLRYGIVESDIGVGYDWPAAPWLTLSAEAFDPNDLRANIFGVWGLGGALRGWSAITGYRKLGGDGSATIGLRAER
jgi:phospholipid/cholesterol/gamma-HCH transport system substrate-binding protein